MDEGEEEGAELSSEEIEALSQRMNHSNSMRKPFMKFPFASQRKISTRSCLPH